MIEKKSLRRLTLTSALIGLSTLSSFASSAEADSNKSTVTATSKQMNVPVNGTFNKFTARLIFDPAKPTSNSTNLSIDTASYDLGDAEYDKQVRGKDWFDSDTFPTATFVSTEIAPVSGNQYKVTGKLTIKGKSQVITVPVTIKQEGAAQVFDGSLQIKRTQYDVGTGPWKDTSIVADDVVVKFHIVTATH